MSPELLARFDLRSDTFLQDPYPVLAELRETAPIFWYEPTGQWFLTRHEHVHDSLRDRRLGRIYSHRYTHTEFGRAEPDPRWRRFADHERWSLLQLEPPDHTRIRRLIAKVFTAPAVASLRPFMAETASALLHGALGRGRTFDLIGDVAQPYSVAVICELLGVPSKDTPKLLDWSHAIVKMYELTTSDQQRQRADDAAAEFMEYTYDLLARKRAEPDDRLASALVHVEDEGTRLSDAEIMSTVIVLLNAGHEATVNTTGNGTRALLLHPGEWDRLVQGQVSPRAAVEELIRWDPPLQLFERWVLDDGVEIAGQTLAVGQEIAMLFGSANRDQRRFADADRFDVGRGDTGHVGFGGGIHFCVGAPLARLELEVLIDEIVRTCPQLRLAAAPVYHPTFVIHGLTRLELVA